MTSHSDYLGTGVGRPFHGRLTSSTYLVPKRAPSQASVAGLKSISDDGVDEEDALTGLAAFRLGSSFFVFGTLIAMQFSVVTAAAGDLVGDSAPKAAVLTAYTIPSVLVRLLVPFASLPDLDGLFRKLFRIRIAAASRQEVNYASRIAMCTIFSFFGLNLLAWSSSLWLRLVGIALTSCSSNLGDLTFYQLSTRYPENITQSVATYTSGGGAAGLLGALTYTTLTQLGASSSAVLSGTGLVPLVIVALYNFWLPPFRDIEPNQTSGRQDAMIKELGTRAKLAIARPMLPAYMVPLCVMFLVELLDVQGVIATILFYLPISNSPSLNSLFPALRSFYPVYQTVYQLAAFVGRTTVTFFRLPGGERRDPWALWGLVGVETGILLVQLQESLSLKGTDNSHSMYGPWTVLTLILIMGVCGGMTLGNVYFRIGRYDLPDGVWNALAKARQSHYRALPIDDGNADEREDEDADELDQEIARRDHRQGLGLGRPVVMSRNPSGYNPKGLQQEAEDEAALKEFVVSTIGAADTLAILVASAIAMIVEPALCQRQIRTGWRLCRSVT